MPARDHLHERVRKALASDGVEPERELYLAVSDTPYGDVFEDAMGELLLDNKRLKLLVFNNETEVIERWTPEPPTAR